MVNFKIKICGITTLDDARKVAEAGADAIGLNFYEKSSRKIELDVALQIAEQMKGRLCIVGLFVNTNWSSVVEFHNRIGFDYVQLHGHEEPKEEVFQQLPPLIRAFKWPPKSHDENSFVSRWTQQSNRLRIQGYLVDANTNAGYGGTGHLTDWSSLNPRPSCFQETGLVLAGGLTAENVAEAIFVTRPDAVDTASGVESAPGKKDLVRLERFVSAAKTAFDQLKQLGEKQ